MRHPYADFLSDVEKPSRYVGGEYQEVRKDPAQVEARICLAFPDTYEIGMSHLGTKILYSVLNRAPDIACERAFSPWLDMEAELRARGLPGPDARGGDAAGRLRRRRVLAAVRADLHERAERARPGGHPAAQRRSRRRRAAGHRGRPDRDAPRADGALLRRLLHRRGRGGAAAAWCARRRRCARAGVPRRERLIRLAARFPLYVPALYAHRDRRRDRHRSSWARRVDPRVPARPPRAMVADIDKFPFPDDSPVPYAEAIFDRVAVEIARGCTEGCRFCQAGMIYRPVRERDPDADRRRADRRREEGRLRRDRAHLAVDRRLLVRHAAGEGGDGAAARRAGVAVGVVAARLRPQRGAARRDGERARHRADVRARGGHAAHARRDQQERHRGAHPRVGAARVRARLGRA